MITLMTPQFLGPLGAEFQAIDTFTGEAEVDLETLVPTPKIRTGPKGTLVYRTARDTAGILRADRVEGGVNRIINALLVILAIELAAVLWQIAGPM